MKKDLHPQYNTETTVSCACGNNFVTGSTVTEIKTELCSACHPFYTGKQKLVDTAQRVDKFQKRAAKQEELAAARKGKAAKRKARAEKKATENDDNQ